MRRENWSIVEILTIKLTSGRNPSSLTVAVDPNPCSVSRDAAVAPGVEIDVGEGGGGREAPSETREREGGFLKQLPSIGPNANCKRKNLAL